MMDLNKLQFTKGRLEAIAPGDRRAIYYDAGCRGLTLFVLPNGRKSFYFYARIKGKPKQIKIGDFPERSVENARDQADEYRRSMKAGDDPAAQRRAARAEMTLGELFGWYIENHARPRNKTWETDVAVFKRHCMGLANRQLSEVTRGDIRLLHTRLSKKGPYIANRVLALLRSIYNRAIQYEIVDVNPAEGIDMFRERSRDRRLSVSEVPAFLKAIAEEPNESLRDYLLLALYTGARKGNLLAMRWDQVDFKSRAWRIPETKSGLPLVVPLEAEELRILRDRLATAAGKPYGTTLKDTEVAKLQAELVRDGQPWVFPSARAEQGHMVNPQKGWNALRKRAGLSDVRLHDLRRTLGSWMADTGASLAVVGKTLGHQHQATTAIYARLALDPIREAKRRAFEALDAAGKATDEAT